MSTETTNTEILEPEVIEEVTTEETTESTDVVEPEVVIPEPEPPKPEYLRLVDGTVLEVKQTLIGTNLELKIAGKTLSEAEALFTKSNISRVALFFEGEEEHAIFTNYNATIISKNSTDDTVNVTLFAKTPDKIKDLENQITDTQIALCEVYELMAGTEV